MVPVTDFYMYDPNEQSVGGSSSAASNPSGTVPDYAIATSAWGSPYAMTTTAGPVDASVAAMYGHGAADPASYQYADPSAYGAHGIAYPDNSVAGYAGDSGVGYPDNSGGGYPNNSAAGYPSNSGVEYPADSGPGYTENAGDEYSGDSGAGGSGMYGDHSGNY